MIFSTPNRTDLPERPLRPRLSSENRALAGRGQQYFPSPRQWGEGNLKEERISSLLSFTLLAILILIFGSCSGLVYRTAYNSADSLLLDRLDDYFNLNATQKRFWKERLAAYQGWHRRTELPYYHRLLTDLDGKFKDGLNRQEIDSIWRLPRDVLGRLYRKGLADFSEFLTNLEPEQIEHLQKELEESNREWADILALSPAARKRKRTEEIQEFMEEWTGTLTAYQTKRLEYWMDRLPDTAAQYLAYRRDRQQEFVALLKSRPDRKELKKKMEQWTIGREENMPSGYRKVIRNQRNLLKQMMLELDGTLTSEQRKKSRERLGQYIHLVEDLMRE